MVFTFYYPFGVLDGLPAAGQSDVFHSWLLFGHCQYWLSLVTLPLVWKNCDMRLMVISILSMSFPRGHCIVAVHT